MFLRALAAFVALPGMVAFVVPFLLLGDRHASRSPALPGIVVGVVGLLILLGCVRSFYVEGKGTLAPWSPPKRLVRGGLYRFSRNPMYVGVLLVLAGWALAFGALTLAFYAAVVAAAFHLRVLLAEEPTLARLFGAEWDAFRRHVPRWIGRPR